MPGWDPLSGMSHFGPGGVRLGPSFWDVPLWPGRCRAGTLYLGRPTLARAMPGWHQARVPALAHTNPSAALALRWSHTQPAAELGGTATPASSPTDAVTPLVLHRLCTQAAGFGRAAVVSLLLAAGATPHALSKGLVAAARKGRADIVCTLLQHGAVAGHAALGAALGGDHADVVRLLVQ
eukprot:360637-Chlamydomonas_euryale.AAC.1